MACGDEPLPPSNQIVNTATATALNGGQLVSDSATATVEVA